MKAATREVSLHLVRHGPAANQLISPLTPYVALCGPFGASTVYLKWNHKALEREIARLRYTQPDRAGKAAEVPPVEREFTLRDLGERVGEVLAQVGGLGAVLGEAGSQVGGDGLIHLRIRSWGNELSLVPFELAVVPAGVPGEGRRLQLKSPAPICLTRETVGARPISNWVRPVRVLFAWARPDGSTVPYRSCLAGLYAAVGQLDAWSPERAERKAAVACHLTVLPDASLEDIREACTKEAYTHVFLLAHGREWADEGERRFGVSLHASQGATTSQIVSGPALARALTPTLPGGGVRLPPSVVTLAICDGGNMGSVVIPGGSMAHALHEHGIPWVVASQFPLHFDGAKDLATVWMGELLGGADPRWALHRVRDTMAQRAHKSHDWGAVVAYASVGPTFEEDVRQFAYQQLELRQQALRGSAQKLAATSPAPARAPKWAQLEASIDDVFAQFLETLPAAGERPSLRPFGRGNDPDRGEVLGRRAAAHKSLAISQAKAGLGEEAGRSYERALAGYLDAAQACGEPPHWQSVQALALSVQLGRPVAEEAWASALAATEVGLHAGDTESVQWALGSMVELYLLATSPAGAPLRALIREQDLAAAVKRDVAHRCRLAVKSGSARVPLRDQLQLYTGPWSGRVDPALVQVALDTLHETFPPPPQPPSPEA